MKLISDIKKLAKDKKAIILAHNYQRDEIQDIADVTGDSLELARIAAGEGDTGLQGHDIIVFCGVHFMAESAHILSPQKKVLLPDLNAGCPMADMAEVNDLIALKEQHPDAKVVTYINSTAAVKAHSDVICTSSNALKIVQRIDGEKIIFVPDKNLGAYIQRFTDKEIILWKGYCPTHNKYIKDDLLKMKENHKDAILMVHPECTPEVIDIADEVCSTGQMVTFVKNTKVKKIILGTEIGMIHKLKTVAPEIEYIIAHKSFVCPNMKKIDLEKLHESLENEIHEITIEEEMRVKAKKSLDKMLELSY